MTDYVYSKVAVYAELGGALRLARNARSFATDPVTGVPINITQGAFTAPYLDTDASGIADFTATTPGPIRLTTGATFVDVFSDELPGLGLAAVTSSDASAVSAAASAADAAVSASLVGAPADTAVATIVGNPASATSVSLSSTYVAAFKPEAYGAAGDGVTDDTAAVQAAATAAASGVLYLRRGKIYAVDTITVPSDILITGGGTLKHKTNTTSFALIYATGTVANVTIDEVTFDGNIANQTTWNESRHALLIAGASSNITARNCLFQNLIGDGVYIGSAGVAGIPNNINIHDNTFIGANTNRNGVTVTGSTDSRIHHNYFYKMGRDDMPGAIDVEPNLTTDTTFNLTIEGNTFVGGGSPVTQHAVSVNNNVGASCTGILIANNAIRDVWKYAISIFGNNVDATLTQAAILGNTIACQVSLTGSAAILASALCEVNIANNTINSTAEAGIRSIGSSFEISGNKIKNCVLYGIEIAGGAAESGSIIGNQVRDCGTNASGALGGIHIKGSYLSIVGNYVVSSATSHTQIGLYVESGVKNFIHANTFGGSIGVRSMTATTAPQVFGHNVYSAGFNSVGGTYPPAAETWLVGDVIQNPTSTGGGTPARWVCITAGTPGTWRAEYVGTPTSTTVNLTAIGNAVNTTDKYAGKMLYNTTTAKPVYAAGSTAGSVWNDATGALAHTPV